MGAADEQRRVKYPRTPHAPWSAGATSDDRTLSSMEHFAGREVVVTEKLDGENTTIYGDGALHARSIDGRDHPSRSWVKGLAGALAGRVPVGRRLVGENVFARHVLSYDRLPGFFLLFAVVDEVEGFLPWTEVERTAGRLGIPTVPVLHRGPYDEGAIRALHPRPSAFGGTAEGYVVRLADGFEVGAFHRSVAKMVRADHVQTDRHWSRAPVVPNRLAGS